MTSHAIRCATCPMECSYETSRPYTLGPLRGRICIACEESLGRAMAKWMVERGNEMRRAEERAHQALRATRALQAEALPRVRARKVA